MFLRNTTEEDIGTIACEGFNFVLPAGKVSLVWDTFGKMVLKELYHVEVKDKEDGGAPLPPVIAAEADSWDGKTYAQVSRFHLDYTRIPNRNDLLKIAQDRGVGSEFIADARAEGNTIDAEQIAEEVNNLPIPEEVRTPLSPKGEGKSTKEK